MRGGGLASGELAFRLLDPVAAVDIAGQPLALGSSRRCAITGVSRRTVLICGAGIAGPTLAYWLARHGFHPTVVERTLRLRSSGNPVDVRRGAAQVASRMGILPRLREVATHATGLAFVTASGRQIGPLRLGRPRGDEVEVPRADLATILSDATRDDAEFLFGDSITALRQDAGGVDVTFEHAAPRRFDLVIGTDGLHSTVRTLVFGPETGFVHHLGLYVATLPLGRAAANPTTILMYNAPGRSLTVHPVRGNAGAAFIFRGPAIPDLDHRDTDAHKRITLDAYADDGWQPPELPDLPDRLRAADDLYFDSVSRVRLPAWSRGRVTLLGDAASCVSLFGDGSSLAMIGATTLAETLAATPEDHSRLPRLRNPPPQGDQPAPARLCPRRRAARARDTDWHHRPQPHHPPAPTRAGPSVPPRALDMTGRLNASARRTRTCNRHTDQRS